MLFELRVLEGKGSTVHFERNILLFACSLGLLRSISVVISEASVAHIAGLVIFTLCILGMLFKPAQQLVPIVFFSLFITLILFFFYTSGGIHGNMEIGVFGTLIMINLTLKNKLPIFFSAILLLGTFISLIFLQSDYHQLPDQNISHNTQSFVFVSVGIIGMTYFAKFTYSRRQKVLNENAVALNKKTSELRKKSDALLIQKATLEQLTESLNEKVKRRSKDLHKQMERRQKYLSMTLNELSNKSQSTIIAINEISEDLKSEKMMELLLESGKNLEVVLTDLKKRLDESV